MTTGIYGIRHKPSDYIYVGSSKVSIERRWSAHIRALNSGIHTNPSLQRVWKAHGQGDFEFLILEEIPNFQTNTYYNARETHHIAQYPRVFNCFKDITGRTLTGDERGWYSYAKFFNKSDVIARSLWDSHSFNNHDEDCEVCYALFRIEELKQGLGLNFNEALDQLREEYYLAEENELLFDMNALRFYEY
jgi:hypothetical protein